jgi:hypothetical protein
MSSPFEPVVLPAPEAQSPEATPEPTQKHKTNRLMREVDTQPCVIFATLQNSLLDALFEHEFSIWMLRISYK